MSRRGEGAMLHALTRLHGLALRRPVRRADSLGERLSRTDVTPRSIVAQVRAYGVHAHRAGRLPEEMVIQLKRLYASRHLKYDPDYYRASRLVTEDALLTFIISQAIDAYFDTGDAAA